MRSSFRPCIESLEDRLVPSSYTWTGKAGTTAWANPNNWSGGVAGHYPGQSSSDTAIINSGTAVLMQALTMQSLQVGGTGNVSIQAGLFVSGGTLSIAGGLVTIVGSQTLRSANGSFSLTGGFLTTGSGFFVLLFERSSCGLERRLSCWSWYCGSYVRNFSDHFRSFSQSSGYCHYWARSNRDYDNG